MQKVLLQIKSNRAIIYLSDDPVTDQDQKVYCVEIKVASEPMNLPEVKGQKKTLNSRTDDHALREIIDLRR